MIGLLQCDHVAEQFRSIAGDYDQMFREWLPGDWRVYDVTQGERPSSPRECDAYVTTGSKASVYDDEPWIRSFADLVRSLHQANAPFLGVCFGHQMMAHALGGRVEPSPKGWGVGVHAFQVSRAKEWMQPPMSQFRLLMSCRDQVQQLPPDSEVLASSDHCPVALFQIGSMLGVQGHPEFPVTYAEALLRHRAALIGEPTVSLALATLSQTANSSEFRSWACNFLFRNSFPDRH